MYELEFKILSSVWVDIDIVTMNHGSIEGVIKPPNGMSKSFMVHLAHRRSKFSSGILLISPALNFGLQYLVFVA